MPRVNSSRAEFAARLVEGVRRREGTAASDAVVPGGTGSAALSGNQHEGRGRMRMVVSDAIDLFCGDKELQVGEGL